MILKELKLLKFRRYSDRYFQFNQNLNFISGINGSGKTSVLEAIHYLSLTKSFRTNINSEAINDGQMYFQIFGTFLNKQAERLLINLNYSRIDGKRVIVNGVPETRVSDHIGKIPIVILSPDSVHVTDGTQSERRSFIDKILSQAFREYFVNLLEFRRRLSARNQTLIDYFKKGKNQYDAFFESQDELLVQYALKIHTYRMGFQREFNLIFQDYFRQFSHISKTVDFRIIPNIEADDEEKYEGFYLRRLKENFRKDLISGRTSSGPQYDEIKIILGEHDIKPFGSQGEHKITQIALIFAEGKYLETIKDEPVIYLLDDLFAYLDAQHCQKIVDFIGKHNQVFITATDVKEPLQYGFEKLKDAMVIDIGEGKIK